MKFLLQADLNCWLDDLAQKTTLVAPREVSGITLYHTVENCQQVNLGFTRPKMSIKNALFPITDELFSIEVKKDGVQIQENLPSEKQVIFGVRPCDAHGLAILDAAFINKQPADLYYSQRRENTTLVGVACREVNSSCFCTSVGGAPDDASNMDVMLYPCGEDYYLEVVTPKGEALVADLVLEDTDNKRPVYDYPPANFPAPGSVPWVAHFSDEYWQQVSDRCLSCRVCAYVCPTCRCFITRDEPTGEPGRFERLRCWDSCNGANYRMVAGGHRPRSEKSERLRNRFLCKFLYFSAQYGLSEASSCTGCGRCVDACPVNVDITEILSDFGRVE